jgi:acyl-CoA thioester hydrolase
MIVAETQIRIRYSETDKMGFVYYGNYPQFYEIGRTELFRSADFSYKKLEDAGILMPVLNLSVQYIRPAFYDDLITIKTMVKEVPKSRITFDYEIYNQSGELINKGDTTLGFLNAKTMRPCRPPKEFIEYIENNI